MSNNIQDRRIPREEISSLLWSMGSDISTHSLSMWLKSKTEDEWVVVPRLFCLEGFIMLDTHKEEWDIKFESKEEHVQIKIDRDLLSTEEFLKKIRELNSKYLEQIDKYL